MIFSDINEKRIPKTLNECTKPNYTVNELNLWAERVENWGRILLALLIIAGIALTIVEAVSFIDADEDMILPTVISSVIAWGIYAFLAYCAYHIISLLLHALADITHHTMISANVALFANYKTGEQENQNQPMPKIREASGNKWNCPECGNTLPYDVIQCKCGYRRYKF